MLGALHLGRIARTRLFPLYFRPVTNNSFLHR